MVVATTTAQCKPACDAAAPRQVWYRSTFAQALLGSILLWLAFPPCELWLLAWLAPVPWLLLIRRESLKGRHAYVAIWCAGFVFWLAAIHWLRLPHPANYLGWIALSFYLALYLPAFVGLSRVAVHDFRLGLIVAAPVVWTGLELARAHLFTGFLMAALGHTQYRWLTLIQLSDITGAYGVSFVVMWVAACVACLLPRGQATSGSLLRPVLCAAVILSSAVVYGWIRIQGMASPVGPQVALIQGSIDADWKADPDKAGRILAEYYELSQQAIQIARGRLDLVVWPETMFPSPLVTLAEVDPPHGNDFDQLRSQSAVSEANLAELARRLGVPVLVGIETRHYTNDEFLRFNSAVFVNRKGQVAGRYDKMHLVMFGEYIPCGHWLGWMHRFLPIPVGISPGSKPVAIPIDGLRYAPNICFETVLPHTIRTPVHTLGSRGEAPHVLVNLTNDAWFWGSSELDMHLVCGVFRAVECRRPLLIAANGGLSASIDGDGRIRKQSPRRQKDILLTAVPLDSRQSLYQRSGDWFAGTCLVASSLLAISAAWFSTPAAGQWNWRKPP
jgi:apolipoprotein N-acyltransferase